MLCPECNHNLTPLTLKAQLSGLEPPGRTSAPPTDVVIDFCSYCGGAWSSQGAVNFVKSESLQPLINVLPAQPPVVSVDYTLLVCPKDKNSLRILKRESIPESMTLLRCSVCNGIWFPKKSIIDFKFAQEAKLNYYKKWQLPLHSIYAILLPGLLLIVLGGGILATLYSFNRGSDLRIRAQNMISEPLVLFPSPDQVVISFKTTPKVTTKLKYWYRRDVMTEVWISNTPDTTHTINIKNLELGKTYTYQIVLVEENFTSPEYAFTTK